MSENRQDTRHRQQDVTGQRETLSKPAGAYRNESSSSGSDRGEQAREQAHEMADKAKDRVEQGRERAQQGAEQAADKMRSHADQIPGGQRTTEMTHQAADRVEGFADYLKDNDMSGMVSDLERIVRDHPKETLIAAAAAGFLVGRTIRS